MKRLNLYGVLFLISCLFACKQHTSNEQNTMPTNEKIYQVNKIDGEIQMDGKGSDKTWEKAIALSDFHYPWREDAPPTTTFKALWNGDKFFFLYRAMDDTVIVKQQNLGEKDVVNSDRVEIFFKADDEMNPYYALELDALGRILDTEGRFYRKVDFDWAWPEGGLVVMASIDEAGYWVEGYITMASLSALGMYKGDHLLKAGLYRGEYLNVGDFEDEVRWISWIIPDSEKPDFHIPSSFGLFKLME